MKLNEMPAILPARLKKQTVDLAAKFDQPALFVRELQALLDHYSDHTHRKGRSGEPSPLIKSYKVAPPVMRQVWLELLPLVDQHPGEVLSLCDALWAEPNLDLQILAARLLGNLPVIPPDPVINRLQSWISQLPEKRLLDGLVANGLVRLRSDCPDKLLELISSWLSSSKIYIQMAGLRALRVFIDHPGTENLPSIFRILTPILRIAPSPLRPDILAVLSSLIRKSPAEVAYLLRQNLTAPDNPDTSWIIRQVIDEFPLELKNSLRLALKNNR